MFQYNTIEEALQALRNGEVILVTDEDVAWQRFIKSKRHLKI